MALSTNLVAALVGAGIISGGDSPSRVLRAIATRGIGTSNVVKLGGSGDGNLTRFEARPQAYSGPDDITEIQVGFPAYFMTSAGGEAALECPYTVEMAVEYNGQRKMLTWDSGALSKLIPISNPNRFFQSDLVPLGFTIPKKTAFWYRIGIIVASGDYVYISDARILSPATGENMVRSTASVSQIDAVGALAIPSGGSQTNIGYLGPTMVMGMRSSTSKAWVLLGNSILDSTGDSTGDSMGNRAWPARACGIGDGAGTPTPYIKLGRPTETASNMVGSKGTARRSAFPYGSHLLSEFSTNDLGQASSTVTTSPQNKATVVAALKDNLLNSIWLPAKAAGLKVYQAKISPRVKGPTITSLTASGTTCTATVQTGQPVPTNGQAITIAGANPTTYNGSVTVTSVSGQQFTYTAASAPGSSPATIFAGNGKIYWHDGYTTLANQFPEDGFEPGGQLRDVMNAWFDDKVADGTIDGVIPCTGVEEGSTGKWQCTGGVSFTADGLHHNSAGAAAQAAIAAPIMYAAP